MTCTHRAVEIRERAYSGPVSRHNENPAAHGCVTLDERCEFCGAHLLTGKVDGASPRFGPSWAAPGELIAKVSVISPSAGGEVRGYWLARRELWLAHPVTPIDWPELDAIVQDETGLTVHASGERP